MAPHGGGGFGGGGGGGHGFGGFHGGGGFSPFPTSFPPFLSLLLSLS